MATVFYIRKDAGILRLNETWQGTLFSWQYSTLLMERQGIIVLRKKTGLVKTLSGYD